GSSSLCCRWTFMGALCTSGTVPAEALSGGRDHLLDVCPTRRQRNSSYPCFQHAAPTDPRVSSRNVNRSRVRNHHRPVPLGGGLLLAARQHRQSHSWSGLCATVRPVVRSR